MNFTELRQERIRLVALQLLTKVPEYSADAVELSEGLRGFGLSISHDAMRTQLAWLAEQGLVAVSNAPGAMQVAKLTTRGEDAAYGRAIIPGVKRPGPEDSI